MSNFIEVHVSLDSLMSINVDNITFYQPILEVKDRLGEFKTNIQLIENRHVYALETYDEIKEMITEKEAE